MKNALCAMAILAFAVNAKADTHYAASCARDDVAAAIESATGGDTWADGDVVAIPAGDCTWTSGITLNKTITLQGAGLESTSISLGNITAISAGTSGSRITGIEFIQTTSGGTPINIKGNGWRVDNCKFNNISGASGGAIYANAENVTEIPTGLIDNNSFYQTKVLVNGPLSFSAISAVWVPDSSIGTANAVFIEDNYFIRDVSQGNIVDAGRGAIYVGRYNIMEGTTQFMAHGLQDYRDRATRNWELYRNSITTTGSWSPVSFRGGTGMIWGNDFDGYTNDVNFDDNRISALEVPGTGPTGYCDGSSNWDGNELENGYPCRDQIGRGKDSALWPVYNLVSPYCADNGSGKVRLYLSEGHAITMDQGATTIGIVYPTLEGCGANLIGSYRSLLATGSNYIDIDVNYTGARTAGNASVYGPPPTQESEPAYLWLNRRGESVAGVNVVNDSENHIVANRDYYLENASFNGTAGVGVGVLASRPATCTTGVGYWATDQGDWNKLPDGEQGVLYTCTETDTWAEYYEPYEYPHPLRENDGPDGPPVVSILSIAPRSDYDLYATITGTCTTGEVDCTALFWVNDIGGSGHTTVDDGEWTVSDIPLAHGRNTLTVTGWNAENQSDTDDIEILFNDPQTWPQRPNRLTRR